VTLRNLTELLRILFGRLPGQLVVQITNHCNASCPQCGMRKSALIERSSLTAEQVMEAVDQCARNGIDAVSFTGGEPFINSSKALSLLDYAGRRGIRYFFADSKDGHYYPCGYRGGEDLGADLGTAVRQTRRSKPSCQKCHWECFSDPSQLFGIARYLARHPIRGFLKKQFKAETPADPMMLQLWLEDIKYYIRHDFFDGRRPMKTG
jgi:hypothetical protein